LWHQDPPNEHICFPNIQNTVTIHPLRYVMDARSLGASRSLCVRIHHLPWYPRLWLWKLVLSVLLFWISQSWFCNSSSRKQTSCLMSRRYSQAYKGRVYTRRHDGIARAKAHTHSPIGKQHSADHFTTHIHSLVLQQHFVPRSSRHLISFTVYY